MAEERVPLEIRRAEPEDAAELLPERRDFVAVWRYLSANCVGNSLSEELGCLSRKIARFSGLPCAPARLRVCLDVFSEQHLSSCRARYILRSAPVRQRPIWKRAKF